MRVDLNQRQCAQADVYPAVSTAIQCMRGAIVAMKLGMRTVIYVIHLETYYRVLIDNFNSIFFGQCWLASTVVSSAPHILQNSTCYPNRTKWNSITASLHIEYRNITF